MSRLTTLSTFKLFGRTALQRLINRSTSMKFPKWGKGRKDASDAPGAVARGATRHRTDRASFKTRVLRMWFPILALSGLVMMSFNAMFVLLDSVSLDESRSAAVLEVSAEHYQQLQEAAGTSNEEERTKAIADVLKNTFSSPANWLADANIKIAKERFDEKGIAAFAPVKESPQYSGTLAYLSDAGRLKGLRAVGLYFAFINLAMFCAAFGLMGKSIAGADPTLTWLWQFPVSRRVLFSSKLIENLFDNPAVPIATLFYSTILWLCGASFPGGLGVGILLGVSAGVASAALRLAAETIMTQRAGRRTRGAIVAAFAGFGSLAMLASLTASNSQFIVESFVRIANSLPAWVEWNPFSAGVGTDAMLGNAMAWWLAAPAIAIALAIAAVLLAVQLTSNGLACSQDSVRGSKRLIKSTQTSIGRFGIFVWKELLQIRRQPEFTAQVLATPLGIGLMLYVGGYKNIVESATQGGASISLAILIGCSYMLMIAATQMLASEFKTLWLLQCQPRPLADIVRGKARVWAAISIALSVPFIVGALAYIPGATVSILARVPFLWISLWLIAELLFGLTALAATITNEQTVRFYRSGVLPAIVIGHASLAIYSPNWWAQVGALATLIILNIAVRERELVELSWLSEPMESPPKRVYPMHAILTVIGFQTLQTVFIGVLTKLHDLSATANIAISYVSAAAIVSLVCWIWMWRNGLTILPKLPRLPVLRPIGLGLAVSCAAGFAVTMFLQMYSVTPPLAAYAVEGNLEHASYDRWCLFGIWVIAAPLFEEWIIRGLMYRSLRRTWDIAVSVALSAILFATLHPVGGCISLITLGVMTALATEKTNRLWPSITIHAGYNFMIWLLVVGLR